MRSNPTHYREPPPPPEPRPTLDDDDVPVGQVWTCMTSTGICVAMKNGFDEVVRCNPTDPASWFTSTLKPWHFERLRLALPTLAVDFSGVRDLM